MNEEGGTQTVIWGRRKTLVR